MCSVIETKGIMKIEVYAVPTIWLLGDKVRLPLESAYVRSAKACAEPLQGWAIVDVLKVRENNLANWREAQRMTKKWTDHYSTVDDASSDEGDDVTITSKRKRTQKNMTDYVCGSPTLNDLAAQIKANNQSTNTTSQDSATTSSTSNPVSSKDIFNVVSPGTSQTSLPYEITEVNIKENDMVTSGLVTLTTYIDDGAQKPLPIYDLCTMTNTAVTSVVWKQLTNDIAVLKKTTVDLQVHIETLTKMLSESKPLSQATNTSLEEVVVSALFPLHNLVELRTADALLRHSPYPEAFVSVLFLRFIISRNKIIILFP